ncbi:salivary peroxidase/catechol oxidase-like, partial [Choristoneura fumiferana]|uniref:salivary peroxidase/catechol oxidase-like n=1 Tax=Choristoneura fumiferana TaxID=7141 RepID=UPI003D15DA1F
FLVILGVFLFCVCFCLVINGAGGCFDNGWGCLGSDWLSELCPALDVIGSAVTDLFKTHSIHEEGPITSQLVTESLRCGREISRASARRGNDLVRSGVSLEYSTPAMLHLFSGKLPADAKAAAEVSHEILTATKLLQLKLCSTTNVTPNTFMSFLEHQVIRIHDPRYCKPVSVSCSSSKYRSMDGTCNNLARPGWGRKGAPFTRIAAPRYADGIYAMPVARSGRPLPNPRALSTRLFADQPIASYAMSSMNMQWGQFITHDLMFHAMETTDEGGIQCCLGNGADMLPPELQNDKCIPICVPDDDPFYRYYGIRCLTFVRSVTTPREDCRLGHAEQMNTVTSFLDGSHIYGTDPSAAKKLRTLSGGKLKEETRKHCQRGFLPTVDVKSDVCDLRNSSEPCYLAGDIRINQTPTLAMTHTILLREHNRIATILGSLNPMWSDEKIYQEARRIVIAELQHITYQEWLPLNFGENYFRYYRISPSSLYSRDYSDAVHPGVINSFGHAAFRYLHSMVTETIMSCPANYQTAFVHKLSDHYFNPSLLETYPDSFDDIVRGILAQPAAESDPYMTGQITNLLFKSCNPWGLDLIAMDIQRGRDHGLASYNDYREICGLRRARSFNDLIGEISQDRINALAQFYECVDDIDLFVGGSLESDVPGSILGHTFQCIVAEQFYRTRVGDRFFYDNIEQPHSFTSEQLQEIKKSSMARLICDNTDGVYFVQRRAFETESPYNPKYSCDDFQAIPYVDLTPWRRPVFDYD